MSFGIQVRPGVDDPASVAQVAEHAGFAYVAVRDRSAPLQCHRLFLAAGAPVSEHRCLESTPAGAAH